MTHEIDAESGQAAGRDIHNNQPQSNVINVNFGVVRGGHQTVTTGPVHIEIHAPQKAAPIRVSVQPPPGSVTEEQKLQLRDLVQQTVEVESQVKRKPRTFQAVWGAFQKRFRVTSYHMLPASQFEEAKAWLQQDIARVRSMKSAPKKDPAWRASRYRFIHAAAKEIGRSDDLPKVMETRFGGRSMKDISDDELQSLYQLVAGWKQQARRNGGT